MLYKKEYNKLEMKLIFFVAEDVVRTSTDGGWSGLEENETPPIPFSSQNSF